MEESTSFLSSLDSRIGLNPEISAYLAQLSSFGLDRLTKEPERLSEERSAILEETKDLASQNYKTFIQTAECSKEIFEDFVGVEARLGSMLDEKLPSCTTSCKDFQVQAEEISKKRKLNGQILQKHTQLLEILEIPQLIDTCVKNGYFDEALELANYIRRMDKKHGSHIPLVRSILNEVRACIQSMIGQLIAQLRTAQLTLPVCLKVIGHIRRLDAFSETELRVLFLNARDSWFQTILSGIPSDDAYNHLMKTIDVTRIHFFDIITQYKAIFTDDDEVRANVKRTAAGSAPSTVCNDSSILYSWILVKVESFLSTLKKDLASPSLRSRLDAVASQCMYFGLSFGRVGVDLRPLLVPIFEETALAFFVRSLDGALRNFQEDLKVLSFSSEPASTSMAASGGVLALSFDLVSGADTSEGSFQNVAAISNAPPAPPLSLLEFPPLASFYNDIINALNDFRPTATITLLFQTKDALATLLLDLAGVLVATFEDLRNALDEPETAAFKRLCVLFCDVLVPNVLKCYKCLFPSQRVAEAVGLGVGDVHKTNCHAVDQTKIRNMFAREIFPELFPSEKGIEESDEVADGEEFAGGIQSDKTYNEDSDLGSQLILSSRSLDEVDEVKQLLQEMVETISKSA